MSLTPQVPSIRAARSGLLVLALGLTASAARAQGSVAAIDPGMTREEVTARLGQPSEESHFGSFTYLFYDNGCARKCGIADVVVLDKNIVTDAIFRSPKRTFTGVSSSPQALPPVQLGRFTPEPIRAATADDSAHRGGIVFVEPRSPIQPPRYTRIVPNQADSAHMGATHSDAPGDGVGPAPPGGTTTFIQAYTAGIARR